MISSLTLHLEPWDLAICRLESQAEIPAWGMKGPFWTLSRSEEELSLVCSCDLVPEGMVHEGPWRALRVAGPLDFSLTGIVAGLSAPLAAAGIPVFVISTYDTDYLLVKSSRLGAAREALAPHCQILS